MSFSFNLAGSVPALVACLADERENLEGPYVGS